MHGTRRLVVPRTLCRPVCGSRDADRGCSRFYVPPSLVIFPPSRFAVRRFRPRASLTPSSLAFFSRYFLFTRVLYSLSPFVLISFPMPLSCGGSIACFHLWAVTNLRLFRCLSLIAIISDSPPPSPISSRSRSENPARLFNG